MGQLLRFGPPTTCGPNGELHVPRFALHKIWVVQKSEKMVSTLFIAHCLGPVPRIHLSINDKLKLIGVTEWNFRETPSLNGSGIWGLYGALETTL
jgi:hypothetical protein